MTAWACFDTALGACAVAWGDAGIVGSQLPEADADALQRRMRHRFPAATEAVRGWLGHLVKGRIDRFHLPGFDAMNLLLHEALDGGGPVSLRIDPLGKGMAQMLLELPIAVPSALADELGAVS